LSRLCASLHVEQCSRHGARGLGGWCTGSIGQLALVQRLSRIVLERRPSRWQWFLPALLGQPEPHRRLQLELPALHPKGTLTAYMQTALQRFKTKVL
jgi:hypothetical protein